MSDNDQRTNGEDLLAAIAHGSDIDGLKMDALDQARKLYGPVARLQVESVEDITTSFQADLGAFRARVIVRRLDGGAP